jgi:hypothetical protein
MGRHHPTSPMVSSHAFWASASVMWLDDTMTAYVSEPVSTAVMRGHCRPSNTEAIPEGANLAGGPWGEHRVPFVFAANGRSYLKQIETESGIWFRDTRRASNHRRALVSWPTPEGLSGLLESLTERILV